MKFSTFDLHCHSTASDGALAPSAVVRRAVEKGVRVLSLTDHDTIAGLKEASIEASKHELIMIPGIELSCEWNGYTLHILGLNFSLDNGVMLEAVNQQQVARLRRAEEIACRLEKVFKCNLLDYAKEEAMLGVPGRPHFAKAMVSKGLVKDQAEAFKKYLGSGKPGDVKSHWPQMPKVLEWIHAANGRAVIAHPRKYNMSLTKLRGLINEFKDVGGSGIELIVSGQKQGEIGMLADLCQRFDLMASVGSDFHGPHYPWAELGRIPPLPKSVTPIWSGWGLDADCE